MNYKRKKERKESENDELWFRFSKLESGGC